MKPEPLPANPQSLPQEVSPTTAHVAPPSVSECQPAPIPEERIEDWRWIFRGRGEGRFDQYAGQHIAVFGQKLLGSSLDPESLRDEIARKYNIHPGHLAVAYIDYC